MSEAITQAVAQNLGEVSLAIAAIVHAIKKQPGFDVSAYDSEISRLLKNDDVPLLMRKLLDVTLEKPTA